MTGPKTSEITPTKVADANSEPSPAATKAADAPFARPRLTLLAMLMLAFGGSFGGVAFSIFQVRFLVSAYFHGGL